MTSALNWIQYYLISVSLIIFVADSIRRYQNYQYQRTVETAMLELTPPASTQKEPVATEQLFTVLHSLTSAQTMRDLLLGRRPVISFEVVSSRHDGIRYVICLPKEQLAEFQQQIVAYLPGIQFHEVKDYLSGVSPKMSVSILDFKQAMHYAYPLAAQRSLSQHDPISYIASSMTMLEPDVTLAFQVVLSPVFSRRASRIKQQLVTGQDPKLEARHHGLIKRLLFSLVTIPFVLVRLLLRLIIFRRSRGSGSQISRSTAQSGSSQQMNELMINKLSQPLYQTSIRVLIAASDPTQLGRSARSIQAAVTALGIPGYQQLYARRDVPSHYLRSYRKMIFLGRLQAPFQERNCILSVSEIAGLYHFPYGASHAPENMLRSHSQTLPAPALFKARADTNKFDIVLGQNNHHGSTTPLGLTAAERERHVYVVGGTGNGKTTLLQYALVQDIQNGKGVAVIDPHGDLSETILQYIPKDRLHDVIYMNPFDISHPIGLNVLELPEGLSEDELLLEQDFTTEAVVSIFRKIFSDNDSGGHRIEHMLRNVIHTAFAVPNATLFTVYQLLTDATFRRPIVAALEQEDLQRFWWTEFNMAGDYQKVKMISGVTAKLSRFQRSAVTRRMMEQPKSTIDFDDIIQSGKILVCNFSKGNIGEDTSAVLGTIILVKLQLAALRRARMNIVERCSFYLYVDELQNFATMSFVQMLSEARKYKLFLTMAEQSTSQQEDKRLTEIILANVGTVITFRTGNPTDEQLLLPLFQPYVELGEISNLPAHHFFMKTHAVDVFEPTSGETVLLAHPNGFRVPDEVITTSRQRYGVKYIPPISGLKVKQSQTILVAGRATNFPKQIKSKITA